MPGGGTGERPAGSARSVRFTDGNVWRQTSSLVVIAHGELRNETYVVPTLAVAERCRSIGVASVSR